jgi:hypothetical protein
MGMRLQTDPTVIYGLGEAFDGNLRRRDLETDTPYNTYTRFGLPPTPIALPGLDALNAAVNPASGDTLYFVADGKAGMCFPGRSKNITGQFGDISCRRDEMTGRFITVEGGEGAPVKQHNPLSCANIWSGGLSGGLDP